MIQTASLPWYVTVNDSFITVLTGLRYCKTEQELQGLDHLETIPRVCAYTVRSICSDMPVLTSSLGRGRNSCSTAQGPPIVHSYSTVSESRC